jgi:hypothetical protein
VNGVPLFPSQTLPQISLILKTKTARDTGGFQSMTVYIEIKMIAMNSRTIRASQWNER